VLSKRILFFHKGEHFMEKLIATDKAIEVIELLKKKHGNLLFQQSSGCCDGTVPMCFQADGHYISSQNVLVGEIAGVPYYIDKTQDEYLKHMQIIVDAIEGQGASFSLESAEGYAFMMHSKVLEIE
jgi:uncharacterized protein